VRRRTQESPATTAGGLLHDCHRQGNAELLGYRQNQHRAQATQRGICQFHPPAIQARQIIDDGQSQPGARHLLVRANPALNNSFPLFGGKAGAVVVN
jgi:hypothetical protein